MNEQAKIFYAKKFFPHLTERFGVLAVEAVLASCLGALVVQPR